MEALASLGLGCLNDLVVWELIWRHKAVARPAVDSEVLQKKLSGIMQLLQQVVHHIVPCISHTCDHMEATRIGRWNVHAPLFVPTQGVLYSVEPVPIVLDELCPVQQFFEAADEEPKKAAEGFGFNADFDKPAFDADFGAPGGASDKPALDADFVAPRDTLDKHVLDAKSGNDYINAYAMKRSSLVLIP